MMTVCRPLRMRFSLLIALIPIAIIMFNEWNLLVVLASREDVRYAKSSESIMHDGRPMSFPHLAASDDDIGVVNVVQAPYHADPTGKTDSTRAIQAAIERGRVEQKTIYVPLGTYVITDTLNCTQHRLGYFHPVVMVGGTNAQQERPVFVLPDSTASYMDAKLPKYVVHYWEDNALPPPRTHRSLSPWQQQGSNHSTVLTNVHYNQIFQGIDIHIGANNHGAVGIRLRGAQGSNIENTRIDLGDDGLVGVVGASGSGGSHTGLTVVGGKYGLDFRMAQPAPTLTACQLANQTCAALLYAGLQTLTAVGLRVEAFTERQAPRHLGILASVPIEIEHHFPSPWLPSNGSCAIPSFPPRPQPEGPAISGQMSLIDTTIDTNQPKATAISSPRSLYVRNVFVRGCQSLVLLHCQSPSGPNKTFTNPGSSLNWTRLEEAAFTVQPPITHRKLENGTLLTLQYRSTIWQDGARMTSNLTLIHGNGKEPPVDIVSRHIWNESVFPTFHSVDGRGVNVKSSPYNAIGDGVHDDTVPIQRAIDENEVVVIPKGIFQISATLKLKADTKLIGVGHSISILRSWWARMRNTSKNSTAPVIETFEGPGSSVMAFLYIAAQHPSSNYAFLWQTSGDGCICRQLICRTSLFNLLYEPNGYDKLVSPPLTSQPLMVITGGGQFYTIGSGGHNLQLPDFRQVLVVNSTAGARFYHLNTEHGRGDANTEIRSSSNVDVYGFKSEGNFVVMWLRNCTNVTMSGFGGNAAAYPLTYKYPEGYAQFTPSLFRIEKCKTIRLANLMDFIRVTGGNATFYAGEGVNPHLWSMLLDVSEDMHIPPMDRPVLYFYS